MSHSATTFAFGCRSTPSSKKDPRLPMPTIAVLTGLSVWNACAAKAEPSKKNLRSTSIITSALVYLDSAYRDLSPSAIIQALRRWVREAVLERRMQRELRRSGSGGRPAHNPGGKKHIL